MTPDRHNAHEAEFPMPLRNPITDVFKTAREFEPGLPYAAKYPLGENVDILA